MNESTTLRDPNYATQQVFPAQAELYGTYSYAVNADTTLADLGLTLPDRVIGVELVNETDEILRFGFDTANGNSGGIPQSASYAVWAKKAKLERLHVYYGAASQRMTVYVYVG